MVPDLPILVGVRIRPRTQHDTQTAHKLTQTGGRLYDKTVWVERRGDYIAELDKNGKDCNDEASSQTYHRVFGPDKSTQDVWDSVCASVVSDVLDGINASILAYGQTGSGKTHTIMGNDQEPGVIVLAIDSIFHSITESRDSESLVRVSYAELYNEEIRDLFQPGARELEVTSDKDRGSFVKGLQASCMFQLSHCFSAI